MISRIKPFTSFVIYCHQAAPALKPFMAVLGKLIHDRFENAEVILVDDASSDNTAKTGLESLKEQGLIGSVLVLPHRHYRERALFAGSDKSIGDFVLEFDACDPGLPIHLVPSLFEKSAAEGADLVALCPDRINDFATRLYYRVFNHFSELPRPIVRQRILLSSRRSINALLNIQERTRNRQVLSQMIGFTLLRVNYPGSDSSSSNLDGDFWDRTSIGLENLIAYTKIGARLPMMLSAGFAALTVIILFYTVISLILRHDVASGWASLMLFMGIGFSGIFLILALLSLYVTKVLRETVNLPIYTVREILRHCVPHRT